MRMLATPFGAMLLCTAGGAFAQAQDNPPAATPERNGAADTGNAIVVTAQRREQALQDVSAAITAIGADRLSEAQVNSLQDLQTVVPSVNFGSDFNQAKIFIRGVGANTSTTGNATGVALHVDGAVVSRAEAQLTSLFDLQRVEVLRGPQGHALWAQRHRRLDQPHHRQAHARAVGLCTPHLRQLQFHHHRGGDQRADHRWHPVSRGRQGPRTATAMAATRSPARTWTISSAGWCARTCNSTSRPTTDLLLTGEYFRQNDNSGALHYLRASFPRRRSPRAPGR